MRQRRILQTFSVTVLGIALACAPMAVASAKSKHHTKPKPKHHPTKTACQGWAQPGQQALRDASPG